MVDDKQTRMQQLVRELNEASDAYYNGRGERMTDYEWDARFDELRRLRQGLPSPTPRHRKYRRTPSPDRRRNMSSLPSRWRRRSNLPNW